MKIQDIGFILLLILLIVKKNYKLSVFVSIILILISIPLFYFWFFFTAERFIYYSFFILLISLFFVWNKKDKNTDIFVVRHGEIDNPKKIFYGRTLDFVLNKKGISDIEKLSAELKAQGVIPDIIYSSPLKRTIQTSKIMMEKMGIGKLSVQNDLNEVNIPSLISHSLIERHNIYKHNIDEYSKRFVDLGNESRKEISERMYKIFKKAFEDNKGRSVFIVSHGDPIRFLLYKIMNLNEENIPSMSELEKTDYLGMGQAFKITLNNKGDVINKELVKV